MARFTQYVGLTDDAKAWLEMLTHEKLAVAADVVVGYGIGEEPVYGKRYQFSPPPSLYDQDVNAALIVTEVLQISPWSSGPMLFTHLKVELQKKVDGHSLVELGHAFSWVWNPLVDDEYDRKRGHYNV